MSLNWSSFPKRDTKPVTILSYKQNEECRGQIRLESLSISDFESEISNMVNKINEILETEPKIDKTLKMKYYTFVYESQNVADKYRDGELVKNFIKILKSQKTNKEYFYRTISFIYNPFRCIFNRDIGKLPKEVSKIVKNYETETTEQIYKRLKNP